MTRFRLFMFACLVFSFTLGIVTASPAHQSDPAVITADNIDNLALLGELPASDGETFTDFFISPDGRYATISGDNHVQIWNSDYSRETSSQSMISRHYQSDQCNGTCKFTAVALHDNHVALGTDYGIFHVFDLDTDDLIHTHWEHHSYRINDINLTSSLDGFASIDNNGTIAFTVPLADTFNHYYTDRWIFATNTPFYDMAIDPTSRDVAVGGGNPLADDPDTRIHMWDNTQLGSHSIPEIYHVEDSDGIVYSLQYSPDGQLLVTGDGDENDAHFTLRFWQPETREMFATMRFNPDPEHGLARPESISFSADGSLLAVDMGANQLFVWEVDDLPISGEVFYDETIYRTFDMAGNAVFSPDGRLIVANASDVIQIWGILTND